MDIESLRKKLTKYGQEHLLKFWDKDLARRGGPEVNGGTENAAGDILSDERRKFYEDLMALDLENIMKYFHTCTEEMNSGRKLDDMIEPLTPDITGRASDLGQEQKKQYEDIGLQKVYEGKVAVLLLAGGQGTRLGVTYPKGMYDVGLPSNKTLYQLQAERISKVQQMSVASAAADTAAATAAAAAGRRAIIPWYVMTSEHTQEETERFFRSHQYFGLNSENIIFFEQNVLPCMSHDGKIILESPYKISRAPDGNGGLYKALEDRGILDDMSVRGVEYIHVYCVDNILVRLADPLFIGYCIHKGVNCAAKVVEKVDPAEPVGVVCGIKGAGGRRYQVIEYSEISKETSELREEGEGSKLLYRAGGIANHFITTEFLKYIAREKEGLLKHHVAKKKIPYCDEHGNLVKPTSPNGIKMEKFVFDIYPFSDSFAVWEVLREEEFSPLKNADGAPTDTPTTSRRSLLQLHGQWIMKAGGALVPPPESSQAVIKEDEKYFCEISPLLSYSGEGLEELVKDRTFTSLSVIDSSIITPQLDNSKLPQPM